MAAAVEEGKPQWMSVPSGEIKMADIESNDNAKEEEEDEEEEEDTTIVERGLMKRQSSVLFPPER